MKICSIKDCEKKYCANGYCAQHNARFKKYGNPLAPIKSRWDNHIKVYKKCLNPTCEALISKGKYCGKCRMRKSRYGDISSVKPPFRKYHFNEKILDTWTKESIYLLGWGITDGGINRAEDCIGWHLKDKEATDTIQKIIQHPRNAIPRPYHNKVYWNFNAHSVYLVSKFKSFGVYGSKSLNCKMPQGIPNNLMSHFVRGVVEGDGSVIYSNGRLWVFINSSSYDFITELQKVIPFQSNLREMKIKEGRNRKWRIVLNDQHANTFCNWIYQNSEGLRLTRKWNKSQAFLSSTKK